MKNKYSAVLSCFLELAAITSCVGRKNISQSLPPTQASLRFLDQYQVPHNFSYRNTTVGGLSGIDYDSRSRNFYFVCDDRSAINPARFYTGQVLLSGKSVDSFYFTAVTYLRQPGGATYPDSKTDPQHTPDPEAIQYSPVLDQLVWSSEGERIVNDKDTLLQDASLNMISLTGEHIAQLPLPVNLKSQAVEKGPRRNSVLEGMTFADNYQKLYVSVEEPLYEDGPRADLEDNNAFARITCFDMASKIPTKQFAYKLANVARPPEPATGTKINGISEILAFEPGKLLVVERSYSSGSLHFNIKVFLANLSGATDISKTGSLKEAQFIPMAKSLLLNMDDLGILVDNVEGVTFGPTLPNGRRTLVFVTDNNFNPLEKTQLLLFEVIE